jgi:hypothetical protein
MLKSSVRGETNRNLSLLTRKQREKEGSLSENLVHRKKN